MAFLDNSGDIILDAVLTDTGRMRLAKGDGSFRIVKFGLGDDEIDYSLFNKDHASGSAYFDLEVMQTPVLEAFTNNASSMKNKLISFSRTDLLYLPVIKINELTGFSKTVKASVDGQGMFFVTVDSTTTAKITAAGSPLHSTSGDPSGLLHGDNTNFPSSTNEIQFDQGIDHTNTSPSAHTAPDLTETSYIIQIDNRFGQIHDVGSKLVAVSYIDDDNVASYYVSQGQQTNGIAVVEELKTQENDATNPSSIAGSRGTKLRFKVKAATDLQTSTFLFTQVGGGNTITINAQLYYYIDSNIRITGATTGYSVDVPVRFLKHRGAA
jgi:hypothetical protein